MSDWENYYKVHATRKPREQVVRAVALCSTKEVALDLGAGSLVESTYLLESGFKSVVAVDSSNEAEVFAKGLDSEKFTLKICTFENFVFEDSNYDLITAQYALPFHGSKNFKELIENIIRSLKPGGVFAGQFFGIRDEWNTEDTKLSFQTRKEALNLLRELNLIEFEEEEREAGTAAGGMKHWHVFHFIGRKHPV